MARFWKLKHWRENAALSKTKLSRLADVSRDVISSAEKGGEHNSDRLHALLNALNDHHYSPRNKPLDPAVEITH